ncbi:PIG-L deacetylase family protein [Egbenema bharatensis]|uniref:PIG-L deacetylase family protein n=1 Tax=Egbenema bharatensis TaxID=3463334 RepID=UPI003A8C4563
MVFAPHQDDETLGCGGLIALKRQWGVPVSVVFLTDGHASPASSQLNSHEITRMRKQEAIAALDILGVASKEIHFLDQPDQGLRYLSQEQRRSLVKQLVQLLERFKPDEVYVTHQFDLHPDHEATFELVRAAVTKTEQKIELFQYPIWAMWAPWRIKSLAKSPSCYRLPIKEGIAKKRLALKAYRSQWEALAPDADVSLPPEFLSLFLSSHEIFFKVQPEINAPVRLSRQTELKTGFLVSMGKRDKEERVRTANAKNRFI